MKGGRRSRLRGRTLARQQKGVDKEGRGAVFHPLFRLAEASEATLPGSSVAEQVTVNHLVVGSIPTRAAILTQRLTLVGFLIL